jgi:DNA-binding winged helix-turn-helix (wHTH) protein/TolB-like protein
MSEAPWPATSEGESRALHLSGFVLDLRKRELLTAQGEVATLRKQALDVLVVLGERAGEVVSRDELMRLVWPDVVVGEGSLAQAIADIRRVLGDSEHRLVRNVARRGYMLVPDAPPATALPSDEPPAAAPVPPVPGPPPRWRWIVASLALLVLGIAGWWAWQGAAVSRSTPPVRAQAGLGREVPPLSIVVLPLTVEGESKDGEWFADALLGDLTTEIARLPGSFVIGRDTAHTYKGKTPDPRDVARELGVRFVVRGSLRHEGQTIRLNLALVEGENGVQRWAEKFVVERARLAQALDDLVLQLARVLSLEVTRSAGDRAAAMSPDEVTADDLAMRGIALWIRGVNRENLTQALALLEQAVAKDPNSIRGWGGLAFVSLNAGINGWTPDRPAAFRRVDDAVTNLERLDPEGNYTLQAKTAQYFVRKDWPAMLRASTAWVEQHGYHPSALGAHGIALVINGRAEEGVAPLERALRLSPRDSFRAEWQYRLALTHFYLGQYEKALDWGQKALATNPGLPLPPIHAAALVRLGRKAEGQKVFDDFLRRHPTFDAAQLAQRVHGTHPRVAEGRERLVASLRELGLR